MFKKHKKLIITGIAAVLLLSSIVALKSNVFLRASGKSETYMACGCGPCGGDQSKKTVEIHSMSEFEKIKEADSKIKGSEICKYAGCSLCITYVFKP